LPVLQPSFSPFGHRIAWCWAVYRLAAHPGTAFVSPICEVDIKGTPGSRLTHEIYADDDLIGTWSTGTKAINAIPFVCAAKPGLVSPLDLPLGRMLKLHD
jgi:hypothetical protein